jgi:hypothetical protein
MKKFLTYFFATMFVMIPVLVSAQGIGLQNPINVNSISDLILIVTRVIRYIAIPFVVIMIMYSGYLYIAADYKSLGGSGIAEANKTLKTTLIGAFILLSSELIALVIRNTINGLN